MAPTISDLDQLFRSLQHASGNDRVLACQRFCRAIIQVQRRGELGIVPAASWIEAALQSPELEDNEVVKRFLVLTGVLQSSPPGDANNSTQHWRALVQGMEGWRA